MSSFTVSGGRPLRGRITVPGDKSISHRALLLAALAEGTSVVRGLSDGDDVVRTRRAVEAMGAGFDGEKITGGRTRLHEPDDVLDMGNSGTGIRLLAGMCAGLPWLTVLTGDASIRRRPMDRVLEPLHTMGARIHGRGGGRFAPLAVVGGALQGVDVQTNVASAQVKSAILLAGLGAEGETRVRQGVATRPHTEELLALAGVDVEVRDEGRDVRLRPSPLEPFQLDVPGDPSQAAFWLVAACLVPGSEVVVDDVYLGPTRAGFVSVLARMGADIEQTGPREIRARYSPDLHAVEIRGRETADVIDEIPVLAVAAALAGGETVFADAGELRIKESDRIATVTAGLAALGARYELTDDGFLVVGPNTLHGALTTSHGDHRVAMALAVAGLAARGTTTVDGWAAVATSYPRFESDLERLCGS
ncbi:MAG TPA: 3-phosphoshikimate 1-carboxyvinyltransferase [Acidimicrobiales bacterium]|nr:3-phosphoshikimate 1-carboxyvinyltransferase [Acidimicrobiales bacterium]